MSLCALGLDMALGILHSEALQVISTMRFTLHRLYNSNICEFCVCNFGSLAPQNFTILWCPPRTRNYRGAKSEASLLQLPPSSCCDLGLQKGSLPPGTWNMPSLRVLTQLEASSSWRSTSSSPDRLLSSGKNIKDISYQKRARMKLGRTPGFELYQERMMESLQPKGLWTQPGKKNKRSHLSST